MAKPNCTLTYTLEVNPAAATADHLAKSPDNQQKFYSESEASAAPGCPLPANMGLASPAWTNPAPLAISISSAKDQTNGLATCLASTTGPVTLTATVDTDKTAQSVTVAFTCK